VAVAAGFLKETWGQSAIDQFVSVFSGDATYAAQQTGWSQTSS
jgi:hypothetical protein